jgi:hypothetical protein
MSEQLAFEEMPETGLPPDIEHLTRSNRSNSITIRVRGGFHATYWWVMVLRKPEYMSYVVAQLQKKWKQADAGENGAVWIRPLRAAEIHAAHKREQLP